MAKTEKVPESNGGRIDKRVAQFVAVRDEIARREEAHKVELRPFIDLKEQLIGQMLEFLDKTGQTSAKTEHGTVAVKVTYTAPLTDPDEFMDFVRENDAYELMDRRANASACREFAEENGKLPPGVKINARRTAGVTRA